MIKVYKCNICNRILVLVDGDDSGLLCCNSKMEELVPKKNELAFEKHVPVINIKHNVATVTVSSTLHPMEESHHIEWIMLVTSNGNKRVFLNKFDPPVAKFALLPDEKVIAAYAYCNLHGLWTKEL